MATIEAALASSGVVPVLPPSPRTLNDTTYSEREKRFVIRNVDWATYRAISDALGERHYHLSYDGEDLELMTKSKGHGMYSRLLVLFVVVLTEELRMPRENCGDMSCDREDLARGIEPDECFYLENALKVGSKRHIDLRTDPPPDLAVEIDLTTDARRRLGIHAAIGIPEVWRCDGETVTIYQRQADGQYAMVEWSRSFPIVSAAALSQFIHQRNETDESSVVGSFRQWVRQQLGIEPAP